MKRVLASLALLTFSAAPAFARVPSPPPVVTPEPATIALMAGGLLALGFVASKRKKR